LSAVKGFELGIGVSGSAPGMRGGVSGSTGVVIVGTVGGEVVGVGSG
jgi:hypothetical protein